MGDSLRRCCGAALVLVGSPKIDDFRYPEAYYEMCAAVVAFLEGMGILLRAYFR